MNSEKTDEYCHSRDNLGPCNSFNGLFSTSVLLENWWKARNWPFAKDLSNFRALITLLIESEKKKFITGQDEESLNHVFSR